MIAQHPCADGVAEGKVPREIMIGADVTRDGTEVFAAVEEVDRDAQSGETRGVKIRHGRADYLVYLPARFFRVVSDRRIMLNPDAPWDDLEREAIESNRIPPTGSHVTEAGPTAPAPSPQEILGGTPGMPRGYEGPSTS
jgi:hypothetical protein